MKITGKAWKYGDNIDTDAIIPARYLNVSTPEELARHSLERTLVAGRRGNTRR